MPRLEGTLTIVRSTRCEQGVFWRHPIFLGFVRFPPLHLKMWSSRRTEYIGVAGGDLSLVVLRGTGGRYTVYRKKQCNILAGVSWLMHCDPVV